MPALEALQAEFAAAGFETWAISVDSRHCHANWGSSLGGISLPLLQDFHPKGAVGSAYGVYLDEDGTDDRATVMVDAGGIVRHASSVTPSGERSITELLELARKVGSAYDGRIESPPRPEGITSKLELYVRGSCGFSLRTLNARKNLHLEGVLPVKNVTEDLAALAELEKLTGDDQVPCLVVDGKPMLESADIIRYLVTKVTGYGG